MKTVRETFTENFIVGWIIDNEYFVASENCPKFDPRDGSPLTYIQKPEAYEAYQNQIVN